MANYKEIVTKAIVSKGKRSFQSAYSVEANNPSTILGCWVINHNFHGTKSIDTIVIDGSYDVNIWYSYDNDTKTDVIRQTNTYQEVIHMREREDITGEEVIVRSLKQPSCVSMNIENGQIRYEIEQELGIELVGDVKVKVETSEEEDPWDEIVEENGDVDSSINNLEEEFIEETL